MSKLQFCCRVCGGNQYTDWNCVRLNHGNAGDLDVLYSCRTCSAAFFDPDSFSRPSPAPEVPVTVPIRTRQFHTLRTSEVHQRDHFAVVIRQDISSGEYTTHIQTSGGGYISGNYFERYDAAENDYRARCQKEGVLP